MAERSFTGGNISDFDQLHAAARDELATLRATPNSFFLAVLQEDGTCNFIICTGGTQTGPFLATIAKAATETLFLGEPQDDD